MATVGESETVDNPPPASSTQPQKRQSKLGKLKLAVIKTIDQQELSKAEVKKKSNCFMDVSSQCGDSRYKIGLIDFLTKYEGVKLLENEVKAKINRVDNIEVSAID